MEVDRSMKGSVKYGTLSRTVSATVPPIEWPVPRTGAYFKPPVLGSRFTFYVDGTDTGPGSAAIDYLHTSAVQALTFFNNGAVEFRTLNSVYRLEPRDQAP